MSTDHLTDDCPKSDGAPHCVHDVLPFRQFGARQIDEFCCRCGARWTYALGVSTGGIQREHGPFLKVFQRRFTPPPDRAA